MGGKLEDDIFKFIGDFHMKPTELSLDREHIAIQFSTQTQLLTEFHYL